MNSLFHRSRRLAAVSVAVTSGLLSSAASAQAVQSVTNGGARQWIAFDPSGRDIGPVAFLFKIVQIVNTSNQANAYTITYEPQHLVICAGTLAAGAAALCGVQPTQHLSAGYFQAVAQQAVLMGGRVDMPTIGYTMDVHGVVGADTSHGTIQNLPLVWQAGCPPRAGAGCPAGQLATGIGTIGTTGVVTEVK